MVLVRRVIARLSGEQYKATRKGVAVYNMSLSDFIRTPALVMAIRDPQTGKYLPDLPPGLVMPSENREAETYVCNLREERQGPYLTINLDGRLMHTSEPERRCLLPGRDRRAKRRNALLTS